MIEPIIHRYDSVGSTNDIAIDMARSGAPEGTVVLAQSQSKGRGRRGREWFDKPGESILMSAILRPDIPLNRYSELAFAAAVAVAECVEAECGLQPSLKWPNDVLVREKKLAGILIESAEDAAIVGIGVNVKQTAFPPELSSATSIALENGRCTDVETLTRALISRLFSISALDFEEIAARWRKYMWGIGRLVEVASEGDTITGSIAGIDTDGALLIDQDGKTRRVVASTGITQM
jgi:BirA family biotin operon repressor/biotin-[acetyl-CoA-carboxylase] ligase